MYMYYLQNKWPLPIGIFRLEAQPSFFIFY